MKRIFPALCALVFCSIMPVAADMVLPRQPLQVEHPDGAPAVSSTGLPCVLAVEMRGMEKTVQSVARVLEPLDSTWDAPAIRSHLFRGLHAPQGRGLNPEGTGWFYVFLQDKGEPIPLLVLPALDNGEAYLAAVKATQGANAPTDMPDAQGYIHTDFGSFYIFAEDPHIFLTTEAGRRMTLPELRAAANAIAAPLPVKGDVAIAIPDLSAAAKVFRNLETTRTVLYAVEALYAGLAVLSDTIVFHLHQQYNHLAPMTRLVNNPVPPAAATTCVNTPDALAVFTSAIQDYSSVDSLAEAFRAEFRQAAQNILDTMPNAPATQPRTFPEDKLNTVLDRISSALQNLGPHLGISLLPPSSTDGLLRLQAYQKIDNMPDIREIFAKMEEDAAGDVTRTSLSPHDLRDVPAGLDIPSSVHLPADAALSADIRVPAHARRELEQLQQQQAKPLNWQDILNTTGRQVAGVDVTRLSIETLENFLRLPVSLKWQALELAWLSDGILLSIAGEAAMDQLVLNALAPAGPPLSESAPFRAVFPDGTENAVSLGYIHLFDLLRSYQTVMNTAETVPLIPMSLLKIPDGTGTLAIYETAATNARLTHLGIRMEDWDQLVAAIQTALNILFPPPSF